ncbi:MAG: hypothetical protein ACRDNP_09825 [Gaiellaceae bacterium]
MNLFPRSDRAGRTAAVVAAIGFAGIALFEVALAAGVPWGHAAWGGAHAHLSTAQRIGGAAAVVVWTAAALIVLGRVGFWGGGRLAGLFRWGTWILAVVSGIGAVLNFASQSRWENLIFGPTGLLLAILCIVVARGPSPSSTRARGSGTGAGRTRP